MVGRWAPATVARDGEPGRGLRVAVAGAAHWHLPRYAEYLAAAGASFCGVSDADGAALLTYQTDDGRVTSRIVRGRVDQENYESEYETPIPWHVCES